MNRNIFCVSVLNKFYRGAQIFILASYNHILSYMPHPLNTIFHGIFSIFPLSNSRAIAPTTFCLGISSRKALASKPERTLIASAFAQASASEPFLKLPLQRSSLTPKALKLSLFWHLPTIIFFRIPTKMPHPLNTIFHISSLSFHMPIAGLSRQLLLCFNWYFLCRRLLLPQSLSVCSNSFACFHRSGVS